MVSLVLGGVAVGKYIGSMYGNTDTGIVVGFILGTIAALYESFRMIIAFSKEE